MLLLLNDLGFRICTYLDLVDITHRNLSGEIPQQITDVLFHEISRTISQQSYRRENSILNGIDRQTLRSRILESPCADMIDVDDTIALRTGQAFLDLIKLGLYLISNNIARDTGIGSLIVSACKLPTISRALERLLQLETATVQAFADGLLHYATEANNEELVRKVISSGVSPNGQCGTCSMSWGYDVCRLQCAILAKADRASISLLELGTIPDKGAHGECLKLCFEYNLITVAKELLLRGVGNTVPWEMSDIPLHPEAWDIISTAALYGGIAAIEVLTRYHPSQLQHAIEDNASAAFVVAASIGNENLVRFWLEEYNVSPKSCAIGLCGASANGQTQTVELLISYGSNVQGDHGYIYYKYESLWSAVLCDVTALEAALGSGHFITAKVLIGHGANAKIKTSVLNSILWPLFDTSKPVHYMRHRTLQQKFERSHVAEPSKFSKHCKSSLLEKRMGMFRKCLDSGTEPNGETLIWLSFAGTLDPLRHLIERGISLDTVATTCFGIFPDRSHQRSYVTALAAAIYAGNDNIVQYLFQNGVNINSSMGMKGIMSPLAASIIQGRPDWTKMLIRSGADLKDATSLWAAAYRDNVEAYVTIDTASQETYGHGVADYASAAASEAIKWCNTSFLRTILQRGINLHSVVFPWHYVPSDIDRMMRSSHPLSVAIQNLDLVAVRWLLDIGFNPNLGDDIENSNPDDSYHPHISLPMLNCLPDEGSNGDILSIANTLIEAGAKVNYLGPTTCHSPLVRAIQNHQSTAFVELLIQKGALVDALSVSEVDISTPICAAVLLGSYQIVQLLLGEGACVSSPPQLERSMIPRTPIQIAAHHGNLDILKLLLEALENGSQFLLEYPLALRLASRTGGRAVANYLQAHRAEKFVHSTCFTNEAILMDLEDEREDRKYWYEFWRDERYGSSLHLPYTYHALDNRHHIKWLYNNLTSESEDIDSESDGSVSNIVANTFEEGARELPPDTNGHEDDLGWLEYVDFDIYNPDERPCTSVMNDSQMQILGDYWTPEDIGKACISETNVVVTDDTQ